MDPPSIREALGLAKGQNLGESRTYRIWKAMKQRCLSQGHKAYDRYGGSGIGVCEEWMDFISFFRDMGHPPTAKHSLDRINPRKGYEPGNCRWATARQQSQNRLFNVYLEDELLIEAARKSGLHYGTVWRRLQRGWPASRLLEPTKEMK